MVIKKKLAAASFGAALASMYVAPNLEADIVDLTFSQTNIAEGVLGTFVSAIPVGAGFAAWNGGTNAVTAVPAGSGGFNGGLALVNYSSTLTNGFTGFTAGFTNVSTTGTHYVGFSHNGNVGWFQVTIAGNPGAYLIGPGEYGSAGESVHVGGTDVIPEPTSLAALSVLALGAAGVRRNRKK